MAKKHNNGVTLADAYRASGMIEFKKYHWSAKAAGIIWNSADDNIRKNLIQGGYTEDMQKDILRRSWDNLTEKEQIMIVNELIHNLRY